MAKGFFKSERTVSPTATGAYGSSSSSHACGQATGGDSFRAAAEKKRGGRRSRGRHARTTDNSGRCAANAAPKRRRKGSVRRTASGLWGLIRRLGRQQGPDIDKTTHSSRPARRHRSARALHQSTPGIEQEVSVLSRDNTGNTIIAAFKAAIATQGVGIAFKSIQSTEAMPMSTRLSHPRGRGRSSSRASQDKLSQLLHGHRRRAHLHVDLDAGSSTHARERHLGHPGMSATERPRLHPRGHATNLRCLPLW